ncbi:MAG TPA: hypothetical protein VGE07_22920 [Herpetosiphonaceae bacterium]
MLYLIPAVLLFAITITIIVRPEWGPRMARELRRHEGYPMPPAVEDAATAADMVAIVIGILGGIYLVFRAFAS